MFIIKYLKSILYVFISILIFTLVISTLNYFDLLSKNFLNILQIATIIISTFVGSYYLGKNSNSKGYIQGLKIGGIIIVILILLNYLGFQNDFKISNVVFYLIILSSSIFGSVFGINKKKKR